MESPINYEKLWIHGIEVTHSLQPTLQIKKIMFNKEKN